MIFEGGIFGGKACASGTLVSGGFQILRDDVMIRESFISYGGFGYEGRVYHAYVKSVSGGPGWRRGGHAHHLHVVDPAGRPGSSWARPRRRAPKMLSPAPPCRASVRA